MKMKFLKIYLCKERCLYRNGILFQFKHSLHLLNVIKVLDYLKFCVFVGKDGTLYVYDGK